MVDEPVGFRDHIANPGSSHSVKEFGGRMQGQHDDGCSWGSKGDFASGFEAVHHRHLKIQHDDIGMQFADPVDGGLSVFGLAADFPFGLAFEPGAQRASNHKAIIDNQNGMQRWPPPQTIALDRLPAGAASTGRRTASRKGYLHPRGFGPNSAIPLIPYGGAHIWMRNIELEEHLGVQTDSGHVADGQKELFVATILINQDLP